VLQAYRGKDIPAVFAEKQRKLAELKAQQQQQHGGAKPRGLVSLLRSTPVRRRDVHCTSAIADAANSDCMLRLPPMEVGFLGRGAAGGCAAGRRVSLLLYTNRRRGCTKNICIAA